VNGLGVVALFFLQLEHELQANAQNQCMLNTTAHWSSISLAVVSSKFLSTTLFPSVQQCIVVFWRHRSEDANRCVFGAAMNMQGRESVIHMQGRGSVVHMQGRGSVVHMQGRGSVVHMQKHMHWFRTCIGSGNNAKHWIGTN
jgi:hypothetical protein